MPDIDGAVNKVARSETMPLSGWVIPVLWIVTIGLGRIAPSFEELATSYPVSTLLHHTLRTDVIAGNIALGGMAACFIVLSILFSQRKNVGLLLVGTILVLGEPILRAIVIQATTSGIFDSLLGASRWTFEEEYYADPVFRCWRIVIVVVLVTHILIRDFSCRRSESAG